MINLGSQGVITYCLTGVSCVPLRVVAVELMNFKLKISEVRIFMA